MYPPISLSVFCILLSHICLLSVSTLSLYPHYLCIQTSLHLLYLPSQTAWIQMKEGIVFAMGDDVFTENPRISVHHSLTLDGAQAWVLTIKNVNLNDTGTYMCSLNTQRRMRKYYSLTVVGEY